MNGALLKGSCLFKLQALKVVNHPSTFTTGNNKGSTYCISRIKSEMNGRFGKRTVKFFSKEGRGKKVYTENSYYRICIKSRVDLVRIFFILAGFTVFQWVWLTSRLF
jgi:hypothetical protein